MFRKLISIIVIIFFVASCGDTMSSVKRGLTGSKSDSTDEFMVKKKDPLILPPDFENLPTPDETSILLEESSIFENTLEDDDKADSPESKSVESSILKKIQSK